MNAGFYKFGNFSLDAQTRQLLFNNESVNLSSKAFDILLYLIENRGKLVGKEELFQIVWADSFVEENNLPVHVSALRRSLREKRGDSRYIKTVSGRGYTFIAPVERVEKGEFSPRAISSLSAQNTASDAADESFNAPHSIAVLPFEFENENADFEYLAGGITQSLIDSLSQIPKLKVMAYRAVKDYRNSGLDLTEIGFQLGVDKILLGTLTEYKNQLDISVELIGGADKRHLWGTQYNCRLADVFAVKKEIALIIAEKLKLQINRAGKPTVADHFQTPNAEAYKLYLKGKYILDHYQSGVDYEESLRSALNFFQQALKKDPNYAPAYVGSGRVYFLLFNDAFLSRAEAYDKCQNALRLAFNADADLSDAFVLQGVIQLYLEHNFADAKKALDYAVELNPSNSYAFHTLSYLLVCLGNYDEAIFYQNQALQLAPTSLILNSGLINRFFLAGRFRQAIVHAEEALELDPRSVTALSVMSLCYAELEMFDEALKNSDKVIAVQPLKELFLFKAYIHAAAGQPKKARAILADFVHESGGENGGAARRRYDYADVAAVYSALKESDKIFAYLEKAFLEGSSNLLFIKSDPRFARSRGDARFDSLLRRLNLK